MDLFDFNKPKFKFKNKVRLIELFAGYGSQALACKYLELDFEHYRICEWWIDAIISYAEMHIIDMVDYSLNASDDEINNYLFKSGISVDSKVPANLKQIQRLKKDKKIKCYNAILNTNNYVDITKVTSDDLNIIDTNKYDYLLTYSFPCQDLSLAGKGKGMAKGSNTRSSCLWELERILLECKELPQVLLMENVTQVSGKKHYQDFKKWLDFLEKLGYANNYDNLIATEYGVVDYDPVPQTRNRTFMVSTLNSKYEFPKKMELQCKLKDFLEDEVDEKFFLSEAMIKYVCSRMPSGENKITTGINMSNRIDSLKAGTITCGEGSKPSSNYIIENKDVFYSKKEGCLLIPEDTKKGYAEATAGDGVYNRPHQKRGVVQKGKIQTIKTTCDIGVVVKPSVVGGIGEKKSNGGTQWYNQDRIYDDNISPALAPTAHPYHLTDLRIRKLTPKECFRLMGVKDDDYNKLSATNSNKYKLAGNSIVVNVLMAIIKELL